MPVFSEGKLAQSWLARVRESRSTRAHPAPGTDDVARALTKPSETTWDAWDVWLRRIDRPRRERKK